MTFAKHFLRSIYHLPFITNIIPTTVSLLKRELSDCKTVLDLGCGPNSPLQYCEGITYSVGVDVYPPYLETARKKQIHSEYVTGLILDMDFKARSFDVVILIDVLEHIDKINGHLLLQRIEKWAKKKVVIITPNGFISQSGYDKNIFQKHLSGWSYEELIKKDFAIRGLAGYKFLRKGRTEDTRESDLSTSMRFHPKLLWFIIATLSQAYTYYFPSLAFSLFCVKKIES